MGSYGDQEKMFVLLIQQGSESLLVPGEVIIGSVCVRAVDNGAASLLDTQERRLLLPLLSSAHTRAKGNSRKTIRTPFPRLCFSPTC